MVVTSCFNFLNHNIKKSWLDMFRDSLKRANLFSTHVTNVTGIRIHDSSVKKKVKFCTKLPKTVLWYCCGPTVYDSPHLGHACSYMHFDIIRRIMEKYFGLNVIMVMNITDIDDKIIAKANELQQHCNTVSYSYEKEFFNDMAQLNISPPNIKARVTENIPEIIEFIEGLMTRGFAYASLDGSVYFNVSKYSGYGKFASTQDRRIDTNQQAKHSSEDFALWKSAKPGEPFWDSPWSKGRPGWHIECSAIACKYLGHSIDIHSGGIDLKFPHHENEEAQCCARHGISQWVNYWIHAGHLFSKGNEKMSKSLKNTVSISDFLNNYSANILRIFCLMIPYRNDVELRKETLEKAAAIDRKISQFLSDLLTKINEAKVFFDEQILFEVLLDTEQKLVESFSDDFDTNKALDKLLHLISVTNSLLKQTNQDNIANSPYCLAAVFNFIYSTLKNLGYNYLVKEELPYRGIEDLIATSLKFRSEIRDLALRINKNQPKELQEQSKHLLKACDSVRENFLKYGIELKDHGKTTTWSYTDRNIKTSTEI